MIPDTITIYHSLIPTLRAARLQKAVALSTVESEYYELVETLQENRYCTYLLDDIGCAHHESVPIYTDSSGAENMIDHQTSHRRTKHIGIKRSWLDQEKASGISQVMHTSTEMQVADIMTKCLPQAKQARFT